MVHGYRISFPSKSKGVGMSIVNICVILGVLIIPLQSGTLNDNDLPAT